MTGCADRTQQRLCYAIAGRNSPVDAVLSRVHRFVRRGGTPSRLREHGIRATRRNVSIDADTEAALRWLRKQGTCTASRLLRDAAREELGRQGMRVWDGGVLTHDQWATRLDATIRERVAEYEGELRSESG